MSTDLTVDGRTSGHRPPTTEFDRQVTHQRERMARARGYWEREGGLMKVQQALNRDLQQGLLTRDECKFIGHFTLRILIERAARRAGPTRFEDILADEEFHASLVANADQQGLSPRQALAWTESALFNARREWHFLVHDVAGQHHYTVSPALAARLGGPSCGELPCPTLRLPVPALLLRVPPEAGLRLPHERQSVAVTEIYAVESAPPRHRWHLWLCAPIDAQLAVQEYLQFDMAPGATLESTTADLRRQHGPRSSRYWTNCCYFLAGAARYLAEGGPRQEVCYDEAACELGRQLESLPTGAHDERAELAERLRRSGPGYYTLLTDPLASH